MTRVRIDFLPEGAVRVDATFAPTNGLSEIPRVGLTFEVPKTFAVVRWFGLGPWENYCDRAMPQQSSPPPPHLRRVDIDRERVRTLHLEPVQRIRRRRLRVIPSDQTHAWWRLPPDREYRLSFVIGGETR